MSDLNDKNKVFDLLKKADENYYNTGKSLMTDYKYDRLRDHAKKEWPDDDYFKTVGSSNSDNHREEVSLMMHMGSQNKASTDEEMKDWYNKYKSPEVIVSDKLDGSSMEVVYEDGKLFRVATRGDGATGMEVTKNARLWKGLPKSVNVKGRLIVRGEAQMTVNVWKTYFPDMANPRNGANGITVCDSGYERNKHINFNAFDIVHPEITFKKQEHKYKALESIGFDTVRWFKCKNLTDLELSRKHYVEERADLHFEIDGMVVAINDLEVQEKLGYSDGGTRPRGQVAWKFDTEKAETEVLSISNTIGHTGKIIPTATLKAVHLAGTTVTHCLLNNFDYIASKDINIGDIVEVEKGGDIIPHITRVITKNTTGPYMPPSDWKGYPLVKEGADWKVVDDDCPDLKFKRIKNWIDKTNIKQIGDTALMAMIDGGVVEDICDLYTLKEDVVSALPVGNGVIGSNAKKILKEIDKTREMSIDLFIGSLSIKHLGRSRAALLEIKDIDGYLGLSAKDLIGKKCSEKGTYSSEVAHEVYDSLQKRVDLISRLVNYVSIKKPKAKVTDGALSSKVFCFSGVRMKPDQKEIFEDLGGVESKKVDSGLTYLVLKDPSSTSSKATKARKLGVSIIGMSEFEGMLS